MASLIPVLSAVSFDMLINILYVALGLGLVIFFHELGHFAVAKWCDVNVERFSIGFGPVLLSFKRGETEYALSAIPFGGYVKMLGQDDMDPSQLTAEELAQDPRSYSSKSVLQRMAIISAGVTMNVITAVLFFGFAFRMGVDRPPAVAGDVQAGMPAWVAGLQTGDTITRINGRSVNEFSDIMRGVALSSGDVQVEGIRRDGSEFSATMTPDGRGTRRIIGVGYSHSLQLARPSRDNVPPAVPGTPAAKASPAFEPGDRIVRIGDTELKSFAELEDILARRRNEPVVLTVERADGNERKTVDITVMPNPFRTLGLWMDIGRITAIREKSPAAEAGIQVGDRITKVDGQALGTVINPLQLPDLLGDAGARNEGVTITVSRPMQGGEPQVKDIHVVPLDRPGWTEQPADAELPLSVPSIGVAFNVIPAILKVDPGSPADKAKIKAGERIRKVELLPGDPKLADGTGGKLIEIEFDPKTERNWAHAFWLMQIAPTRPVVLTVSSEKDERRIVKIQPRPEADWHAPTRGLVADIEKFEMRADGFGDALAMGVTHTRNSIIDIYLTLRNLIARRLSVKELRGPLGIAEVAYKVAEQGFPDLLLFLGFLSVNLAVINFLPIPVLDGGHMVFLTWEAVTRKKPSERVLIAATYFGMAFVLGLMMLVLYLDIFVHKIGRG